MAETQVDDNSSKEAWLLPSAEHSRAAIEYFWERGPKPDVRTLIFKLHNLSRRKIRFLLEAFVFITNLIAHILDDWREDPLRARTDGAIAAAFHVHDKGVYGKFRARALSSIIQHAFDLRAKEFNIHHISSRLIEGAYRDSAMKIVGWIEGVAQVLLKDKPKNYVLTADEFQDGWARLMREYQQATEIIVSLDYDPDHPSRKKDAHLVRQAKRDARWALERLLPLDLIDERLALVEALLSDEPSAAKRAAMTEDHPWKGDPRSQRAVRESWLMRRVGKVESSRAILGQLERSDLETLRDELYEMRSYIERAQHWIDAVEDDRDPSGDDPPASTNHPDRATSEEAISARRETTPDRDGRFPRSGSTIETSADDQWQLNTVLETFLYGRPPGYPVRARVTLSAKDLAARVVGDQSQGTEQHASIERPEHIYERRLSWFGHRPERREDAERFLSERQEAREVQGMFHALRALKPPSLHSLSFIATTRPINYRQKRAHGHYRDGALLFEKTQVGGQDRYRFIFAAILHERAQEGVGSQRHMEQTGRRKQLEWYQGRQRTNPLWYVNFPETPFSLPEGTPVLFFPLECGRYYQERLLREVIERQREAQRHASEEISQQRGRSIPITKCLPKFTPIASARITCSWSKRWQPEFYLHATVESCPPAQAPPTRMIGFSPYEDSYAYAVMNLDGTVEKLGDIKIPDYLAPKEDGRYSDNCVFWLANAMLTKAWVWDAYIVVEDISWTTQRASTSREENRATFSLPAARVVATLGQKARQEGWLEPRLVDGVSPAYDCSSCMRRLTKGTKTLRNEWVARCPNPQCRMLERVEPAHTRHTCVRCAWTWLLRKQEVYLEQMFYCKLCFADPQPVHLNRALVVAQRGLINLVEHHRRSLAKRQRDAASRE
jgi:hypothetical protein